MPKKITIETLATMSQREFTAIREEVSGGFAAVNNRLDGMDNRFDSLDETLRLVRNDLKEIKTDVATVHFDYTELKTRVERLEKKVGLAK